MGSLLVDSEVCRRVCDGMVAPVFLAMQPTLKSYALCSLVRGLSVDVRSGRGELDEVADAFVYDIIKLPWMSQR